MFSGEERGDARMVVGTTMFRDLVGLSDVKLTTDGMELDCHDEEAKLLSSSGAGEKYCKFRDEGERCVCGCSWWCFESASLSFCSKDV